MRNSILRIFIIAVVLVISFLLIDTDKHEAEKLNLSQSPQIYMEDFTQYIADKSGTISSKISGKSLDLFSKKEYALIKMPVLILNLHKDEFWIIKAAKAQGSGDKIYLSGGVNAKSNIGNKNFYTNSMQVEYKLGIGATKDKVYMQNDTITSSGVGAEFYVHDNKIKILSDTFTTYGAPKR